MTISMGSTLVLAATKGRDLIEQASTSAAFLQNSKKELLVKVAQFAEDYPFWKSYAELAHHFISDGSNVALSFASGFALRRGLYHPEATTGKCRKCYTLSGQTVAAAIFGAIPLASTQNPKEAVTNLVTFALGCMTSGIYYNALEKIHRLTKQLQAQPQNNAQKIKGDDHVASTNEATPNDAKDKGRIVSVKQRAQAIEQLGASSSSSSSAPSPTKVPAKKNKI